MLGHAPGVGAVAATASTVFEIEKAALATPTTFAAAGTITFGAASAVSTAKATAGGVAINFAAGDILRVVAPASPDATFTGLAVTLVLSRQ